MDLIGKEIFATGKWNGMDFTEEDLDDIVKNFEYLGDIQKVPLKLGHNDEQPVTDGQPALGWVNRVYRKGQKLLADFTDMPKIIYEAIKNKLYRTVSVELLLGVQHKGNEYRNVLDAVALLGADQPAVNTLEGLGELLSSRQSAFTFGRRVVFDTLAGNLLTNEEIEMDEATLDKLLAKKLKPLEDKIGTQGEQIVTLTKERDTYKSRSEQLEADRVKREEEEKLAKVKASRSEVNKVLDDAVNAKTMTPALRETYARQLGVDDDERVVNINVEEVKLMCGASKKKDDKFESKETGMYKRDDGTTVDPQAELMRLTNEARGKLTKDEPWRSTFTRVCQANPKLHRAYLDSNTEE